MIKVNGEHQILGTRSSLTRCMIDSEFDVGVYIACMNLGAKWC